MSRPPRSPWNYRTPGAGGWIAAAAAVAILAALDQAAGGMAFFRDRLYYFLPQYTACRRALADGLLPLWNPWLNGGQPLLATWQVAVFSPFSLPFLLFPFAIAQKVFWFGAMGVAAGAMFALARRAGLAA